MLDMLCYYVGIALILLENQLQPLADLYALTLDAGT